MTKIPPFIRPFQYGDNEVIDTFYNLLRIGIKVVFLVIFIFIVLYIVQPWFVVRVSLKKGDWELGVHKAGMMLQSNSDIIEHVVSPRETLGGIAKAYGVTPKDLQEWNGITNPDMLGVGQRLVILRPSS